MITKDIGESIRIYRQKNYSFAAMARCLDLSVETVKKHCYRHGIDPIEPKKTREENKLLTGCVQCGLLFVRSNLMSTNRFCCTKCRNRYWYETNRKINETYEEFGHTERGEKYANAIREEAAARTICLDYVERAALRSVLDSSRKKRDEYSNQ